jgi:hypothetical protein
LKDSFHWIPNRNCASNNTFEGQLSCNKNAWEAPKTQQSTRSGGLKSAKIVERGVLLRQTNLPINNNYNLRTTLLRQQFRRTNHQQKTHQSTCPGDCSSIIVEIGVLRKADESPNQQ